MDSTVTAFEEQQSRGQILQVLETDSTLSKNGSKTVATESVQLIDTAEEESTGKADALLPRSQENEAVRSSKKERFTVKLDEFTSVFSPLPRKETSGPAFRPNLDIMFSESRAIDAVCEKQSSADCESASSSSTGVQSKSHRG